MGEARDTVAATTPIPEPGALGPGDLAAALRLGLRDFLRAPLFGLFFSAVYVAGGLILYLVYAAAGQEWWLAPVAVGFPLLAPFAATGLYEVSRRIGAGEALDWRGVLGVVWAQKERQIPAMAAVILVIFLFWMFVAHALFALFLGLRAFSGSMDVASLFLTGNGPLMLAVGTAVGAGFAGVLFASTVVGLPLLLDRDVDFVSAMIASVGVVRENPVTMALWAAMIAAALALAMLPAFLGLFVVLPVFGHATWHLYRRALPGPG
jgi:uncharacterized membrane protein